MNTPEPKARWTSNQEVGHLLAFLGVELTDHTPGGKLSVAEEALEPLRDKHPIIPLLLEYRHAVKLAGMARTLRDAYNPATGSVHSDWLTWGVPTGRFRCRNPNLQQIPDVLRPAFVARPGHFFVAADYDQIELRILAACAGEQGLIDAFKAGQDPHAKTAAMMLGMPLEQVTPEQRRTGKTLNYATLYGTGPSGLARRLGIPGKKAKQLLADYFSAVPNLVRLLRRLQDQAEIHGYVESFYGRRRPLPEIHSSHPKVHAFGLRSAVNGFAQSTAADVAKQAMLRLAAVLPQHQAHMLLTLHDAVLVEVPDSVLEVQISATIRQAMETEIQGVPLTVTVSAGPNWGQLSKAGPL